MTAPTISGQADPGLAGQMARLLQLAANGLDAWSLSVPGRIYRAKAEPPLDCEQLTCHLTRRFTGMPGQERQQVTPSHTPGSTVALMFTLTRPIAGAPTGTTEPVPDTSMDADGKVFANDADALWTAFEEAAQDPTRFLNRMSLQELTSTPEGDFMALRLTVQVLAEQTLPGPSDA